MRSLSLLIIVFVFLGCKKKEQPKSPETVQLVFPEKNSECTTGVDLNATTSEVEFKWQASDNADSYELIVTNLNTDNKQDIEVAGTKAKLPLAKGIPFSWVVISKNAAVIKTATSASWSFYNSGFITSYAPFPAAIIAPEMAESLFRDINNEVVLRWTGSDLDDDISGFDIYLSDENPPETLQISVNQDITETNVTVEKDKVYYWRVITKDASRNTSDSGVFDFRVY